MSDFIGTERMVPFRRCEKVVADKTVLAGQQDKDSLTQCSVLKAKLTTSDFIFKVKAGQCYVC